MKQFYYLTLVLFLQLLFVSNLFSQGGANCAAAMASPVAQTATYNNQNLCNKSDDFDGNGIPVLNYAFNGKDWVYGFTATQSGYQKIKIGNYNAPKAIRPFLGVFNNCPSNANLIQFRAPTVPYWTASAGADLEITIPVYVGTSYTIVVDGHIPPFPNNDYYSDCFSFTLTMQLTPFAIQTSCNNIGFEQGNLNNWMATTGQAIESFPGLSTPFYQIQNIGVGFDRHTIMTGGNDFFGGFPCVAPGLGANSLRLGNQFTGAQAEGVSRTFVVTPENSSFTYWYAVVFQDPNHEAWEQPFFKAMIKTPDGEVINCTEFVVSAAANLPGFFNSPVNNSVRYKPWSAVNIDLSNYLGQLVTVEFTTGDCSHGAHFGYAYIDCICAPSPFLQNDNKICPGESVQLTVPDGYTSYLWNPGNINAQNITVSPSVTTPYSVTVQSPNGCISEYYDTVFVAPNPIANFSFSPPSCASPINFTNNSSISSGTINQTQWIINSTVQSTSNAQYQFPGSGSFPVTMMVTSDQGCVNSITQNVTVPSCALNVQMNGAVICSGGCVTLQVNILDGQAPFQYNWQGINPNGSATQQVCPTNTTTYTVIVTDATGSSTSVSATVTVGATVNVSATPNHISCAGLANGSATANATGGTNITYAWSNGNTGSNISGLNVGNYTVTATNSSGCQSTASVNITSPNPLEIITSKSNSTCGLANGSIQITASGGTSPYTYSIQGTGGPFTSNASYNNLASGNYNVIVKDANGCQAQNMVSIVSTPYISSFQTTVTHPNCAGGNGSVLIANPATSQLFNIVWNGNQIQNNVSLPLTIQNLNASTFDIKLIDENNCEVSQQVSLTAPTPPTSANFDITPATCGNTNGCVVIQNVSGGTAPYQYAINGGAFQASNSFCGLANGSVTVQIRDANLCVLDQNVTIAAPQGLNATATVLQHVSCAGLSDGTAQVTVNDGTAPFSYLWSNGNATNQVSGLNSGEHSVVVTDGNGCSNTFQITVNNPLAISFDVQTTATTCGNNNGTLTLSNLNGGIGNLSISINGNPGLLNNQNLSSGSYNIIITDANGCTSNQNVNITATPFIQNIQTTNINPTCANGNGSISITGANQSLANAAIYLNNNLQTAFSTFPYQLNDLDAGTYSLKINDDNACEIEESISLVLPTPPTSANFDITPATCGNTNGCVMIQNVNGGTAPYQYAINGGAFQANNSFCGLANGSVTVQIRDANLCVLDQNVNIAAPQGLNATATVLQHVSCSGLSDGTAQVIVNNGTAPFTYLWANGNTTNQVSSLSAGEHSVVVTDGNGCSNTFQITVNNPLAISFDVQTTATTCGNNNGTLTLSNLSGGVGNLSISINGNPGLLNNQNLSSGSYNIIITDANGCTSNQNVNITATPFIQNIQTTNINPTCANGNGSISITGANQSLANAAIYLNNNLQTDFSTFPYQLNDLDAGTYSLKIIDANACELEESISLILPTPPTSANFDITPATCGNTNGCVVIQNVSGGTAPFQYAINGGAFQADNSFCGLANGSVTIQIRDANLCVLDQNVTIAAPQGLNATATVLQHVSCAGLSDGAAQVTANDGTAPFTYLWSNGNTTNQVSGLSSGEHSVVVTDGNGCSNTFQITVNNPQAISFDVQTTATTCGNNNGSLTLSNLSGGVGNLSISINGNPGLLNNQNLSSGSYNIIITDANGCTSNQNVNITATPFIQNIQTTNINPTCANGNGSISITGANQSLANAAIYLNNNLHANFSSFPYQLNDLDAGIYSLKIIDANACELEESISLILPTPPTSANFDITPATCGNTNGCVVIQNVSGGTAPFQYAINGGAFQASNSFCGLANGSVTVQIRDVNLCVLDQNVNIIEAEGIDAEIQNIQHLSCFESNDGSAQVQVNAGIAPFTYLWNTGATTAQISNLSAGEYQVTITDNNGCAVDFNVEINQAQVITAELVFVNETCGSTNASIQLENVTGGTGNYTYFINGVEQNTSLFQGLSAGNYLIDIKDENLCSISFQQTIQSINFAQQIDVSFTQPECDLDNGSITINSIDFSGFNPVISLNGGAAVALTLPFHYNNLPDNIYQINITDNNQCELNESVDIQRLSAPSGINLSLEAATCNLNNACLEVTQIQSGSSPYQYAINNGNFSTNPVFCGLAPAQVVLHIKDVNGCQTDTLVQLNAADPVSANITLVEAVKCHGGNDGVVAVNITNGQGPFQVLWNNGVSNLQNENLSAGIYTVEIKDNNNCETQLEIEVPQPNPLFAEFEKTDATCELNNGVIQISNVSGGVSPYFYSITGTFQNQQLFTGLSPNNYNIAIKDQNNCEFSLGNTAIEMRSYPTAIHLAVEDAKCGLPNGKITLQNIAGGEWPIQVQFAGNAYEYQGQSLEFNNLQEGNYQINISDLNACVLSKDTSLLNHLGPEYLETSVSPTTCNLDNGCIELGTVIGGNGTSSYSLNGSSFSIYPTYCNLASGDYLLIVKDMLGCELAIDLFVPATIPVNANADRISDVTCYGGSDGEALAMASVGTGPFNYQWSNGENTPLAQNLNAGDHTAYITDIYGCIDSSAVLIEEPLPLTIEATASDITCAGDSALLSANAYGGVGQILLHWQHNGSNESSVIVNPLETTVYVVMATDENECVMMAQVLQAVNPLPVFNIVSDVEKACTPACVNFGLQGNQGSFVSYQWMIGDSISSFNPDPKVCFETSGSVNAFVMVADSNGCKNTQSINNLAQIHPTPEVSFNYNPEKPTILKPDVQFNETSTHAVYWQWDFGDGFYAYEPNPEYTYPDTGKFDVCLQVMSLHGCKNEVCEPIYIKPVYTFYAPNAFTPNGDGNNDVFKLEGTYLSEVHMIIYNRWGEQLFESFDIEKGWDGTYLGKAVQDDVYTWVATVRTFDKTTLLEKGRVKVMR